MCDAEAEHTRQFIPSSSKLIEIPLPADDPKQRQPDSTKAREILNCELTVAPNEGLVQTVGHWILPQLVEVDVQLEPT